MKISMLGKHLWILLFLANIAHALGEGALTHWPDGKSIYCPYFFPEDSYVAWDQESPIPLTVAEMRNIFESWVASRYPETHSVMGGYKFLVVQPIQRDPLWAYFIEYGVFDNNNPFLGGRDMKQVAIALNGTVVEQKCGAQ